MRQLVLTLTLSLFASNAWSQVNYAALKTELQTNPTNIAGLAAAVSAGQDRVAADLLNQTRGTITIRRTDVSSVEIWSAIDIADMAALPASPTAAQLSTERRALAWLSGVAAVPFVRLQNADGSDSPVIANFKLAFSNGSATLARLSALATRNGSRVEALFGAGVSVTHDDVRRALSVP